MRELLLILGSVLPLIGTVFYTGSILKGHSIPQRMTRFLLVVITGVMTGALWAGGDTSGLWLALTSFLQSLFLWFLSFKHGIGGRDRLDMICLVLCLAGLALWLVVDQPWIGLLASIAADAIAMVPALRKTIRLPHTEMTTFYAVDTVAGLAIMFAGPLTLEAMLFPAYIAVINFAFVLAIKWPRRALASRWRPADS
jgi:hypothetical protein